MESVGADFRVDDRWTSGRVDPVRSELCVQLSVEGIVAGQHLASAIEQVATGGVHQWTVQIDRLAWKGTADKLVRHLGHFPATSPRRKVPGSGLLNLTLSRHATCQSVRIPNGRTLLWMRSLRPTWGPHPLQHPLPPSFSSSLAEIRIGWWSLRFRLDSPFLGGASRSAGTPTRLMLASGISGYCEYFVSSSALSEPKWGGQVGWCHRCCSSSRCCVWFRQRQILSTVIYLLLFLGFLSLILERIGVFHVAFFSSQSRRRVWLRFFHVRVTLGGEEVFAGGWSGPTVLPMV